MKTLYHLKIGIAIIALLPSCSKDAGNGFGIKDIEVNIEENPSNGQILGNISEKNLENTSFSIISQVPEDAFLLNPTNGQVRVNDQSLFDFEKNQRLTLKVFASNGDAEDTADFVVNLEDMDDILYHLNTSKEKVPTGQSRGLGGNYPTGIQCFGSRSQ